MAAVPQRTLNWLYSILIRDHYDPTQTYQDPNRTYYDVANALAQYPSLSPRTDVYTYETGFSTLLLLLAGTLPVSFRGTLYKFPVEVWIPTSYPREPPIVYVTPTHDMVVRVGQHVTLEGRVYHHYLAHWMEAWDKSTLVDLLFILRDVFATEPPVKYKQPVPQPPLSMPMPTPPPVPPLPPGFGPATSTPAMASPTPTPASQVPPPPPPKPGQVVEQQQQQQQQQPPPTGQYNTPPPLPPLPPEELERRRSFTPRVGPNSGGMTSPYRGQPPAPPHMNVHRRDSGAQQYPAYGWQQPPQHYPVQQQQQQLPNKYQTYPQPTAQVQHQRQFSSNPPPPPPPHPAPAPASQPTPITTTTPAKTMAPTPAPAPAPDLLTSPFDVDLPNFTTPSSALPPPIPPNPEKHALRATVSKTLAETLQSNVAQSESAAHALAAQSHSLHVAIAAVQGEISSLKTLNTTLQGNTGILKDSLGRADGVIADARCRLSSDPGQNNNSSSSSTADPGTRAGLPPIDEILVAPTVVGKQLYDLVAEEAGIQQAIYALQGALVKGVIGVETWSRHTRGLAREAFLKRALMRKVARGLGHEGV